MTSQNSIAGWRQVVFVFAVMLIVAGCIRSTHVQQRVVELPAGSTNSTLAVAWDIANALAVGLQADVQQKFPTLTQKQLSGVYVSAGSGVFSGRRAVFILTGIRYEGTLSESKQVADYCKRRVEAAVAETFSAGKQNLVEKPEKGVAR
jgi:hypothetical protein